MKTLRTCLTAAILSTAAGCGGPAPIESISHAGESLSHNAGTNCVGCHNEQGTARSWFTAAGTILLSDGSVRTSGTVTLVGSHNQTVLEIDALGNFYTTRDVGLPDDPVAPEVFDADSGRTTVMPFPTPSASCNFCHSGSNHIILN